MSRALSPSFARCYGPLPGSAPGWMKTPAKSSSTDGASAAASNRRNAHRCPCLHKSPSYWH